ncbi:conserved membrane hypothetical protein [Candidatus Zixiibacteriota bacterium]|nr:conserved membrane hypothetical protein [candidate division Zixibacteria bacterium]
MEHFWEIFPVIAVFGAAVLVVKYSLDFKTRQKLIDKGLVDEKVKYLFFQNSGMTNGSSLKWGMVLVAIGLGALTGMFRPDEYDSTLAISMMLILGGIALILYYAISSRTSKKDRDSNTSI